VRQVAACIRELILVKLVPAKAENGEAGEARGFSKTRNYSHANVVIPAMSIPLGVAFAKANTASVGITKDD
jgi:hypothetical protein